MTSMPLTEQLEQSSGVVPISIIPMPIHMVQNEGAFRLSSHTVIVADATVVAEGDILARRIALSTGLHPEVAHAPNDATHRIELRIDPFLQRLGQEGYHLEVTPEAVSISAAAPAGLFYGTQTLLQLMPPTVFGQSEDAQEHWDIPCVEIEDYPRFVWRGAMLDVSRHFMPLDFLKKFVDLLAVHKLNTLHIHLNDDQGWRIEIKKYPCLTSIGASREATIVGHCLKDPVDPEFDPSIEQWNSIPHAGFYTQDEAKELVAYASARHVTIVPEIDMPGHAQSAIAAYPEMGCTDVPQTVSGRWGIHPNLFNPQEATIQFLHDVLGEIMDIFPSQYIHVGGDEAFKRQWKESPSVQARMVELGVADEDALQSWFIGRMDSFITSRGRRLVGWDEILEGGLAPNAVVMSWRGEEGGVTAASAGHDVIMAPGQFTYLDKYQSQDKSLEPLAFHTGVLTLSTIYNYEPIPKELPEEFAHHVLGSQGQLWTEYMPTPEQVEYQAFPRLSALAEVTWSNVVNRNFEDFLMRLRVHLERLDAIGVNYRPIKSSELRGSNRYRYF